MTQLTKHFSLKELTASDTAETHGIDNTPNTVQYGNLVNLAVFLEQVRDYVKLPLKITSGFRCTELNALVGGRKKSDHLDGRAADTSAIGLSVGKYFDLLVSSDLPYDKIILEYGRWVHISIAPTGQKPRRLKLVIDQNGERSYG